MVVLIYRSSLKFHQVTTPELTAAQSFIYWFHGEAGACALDVMEYKELGFMKKVCLLMVFFLLFLTCNVNASCKFSPSSSYPMSGAHYFFISTAGE